VSLSERLRSGSGDKSVTNEGVNEGEVGGWVISLRFMSFPITAAGTRYFFRLRWFLWFGTRSR
jgi:hypothetical protein